jgi:hypothetical protein
MADAGFLQRICARSSISNNLDTPVLQRAVSRPLARAFSLWLERLAIFTGAEQVDELARAFIGGNQRCVEV